MLWTKPSLLNNGVIHMFLNFCAGSTRVYWRKGLKTGEDSEVDILAAMVVEVRRILRRFPNFPVFKNGSKMK